MKVVLISVLAISVLSFASCNDSTTNVSNKTTANDNSVQSNNQTSSTGNSQSNKDPQSLLKGTENQQQMEKLVKEIVSKQPPKQLSDKPQYKAKVAVFTKEGDNYRFITQDSPLEIQTLANYYATSGEDLRTVIINDFENKTISVIDTTIPAIVFSRKIAVPKDNDRRATFDYMVGFNKVIDSVAESLKKQYE